MKWIMVTGGVGFIGSHVCEELLGRGYGICIVDNMNEYYAPQFKRENLKSMSSKVQSQEQLAFYECDIRDHAELQRVFSSYPIESVIHLAACAGVRPSIEDAPLYMDVNINGTVNILECMKNHGVKQLVFASSSSVYGNNSKVPFCESDFVDKPISPYAATKKAGELICHTYHHLYGINIACLRFFTVYGPRQRPDLAIYKFTNMICKGLPIPFYGDGSMQRDYTYIADTVDGIVKALAWVDSTEKRFDVFNLGESNTVSLSEMVFQIETTLDKKAVLQHLPQQPGDVNITFADNEKSRSILGYEPNMEFATGIKIFVDWFLQNRLKANPK